MDMILNDQLPIWIQLAFRLKERIVTGEFPAGSHFPSVRELAQSAGVNPNTMQRALSQLESEGLLITNRTSGRTVTDDMEVMECIRARLASDRTESYLKEMKALGYSGKAIMDFVGKGTENE